MNVTRQHRNCLSATNETGRATRGMAMSVKARALLYAASKLHNPSHDTDKWKKAAKASYDIIKTGWYTLPNIDVDPLYDVNGGNVVLNSSQLIFERRNNDDNAFESRNLPIGFENGNSGNTPTQNLVDAYEMADGTPFSWENTKHASPITGATLTGYYLRKYMNETVSLSPTNPIKKPHHFILFRYAETLLNYAEAMNELGGPDYTSDADELPMSARTALNMVRSAANMPNITDNGDDFTTRLRNERRIELAFEDHRFWDIRRWMIGDVVKDIYGVKITKKGSKYSYTPVKIQTRVWEEKMNLYPIAQSEIYKNGNLTQNDGWE